MEQGICDKCRKHTIIFQERFWFFCDRCLKEMTTMRKEQQRERGNKI